MQRILLIGSNGFIGQKMLDALLKRTDWETIALSKGADRFPFVGNYVYHDVNIADLNRLKEAVRSLRPTIIIHTAAMAQVDICERHPALCQAVNVAPVQVLVDLCVEFGSKLVYLSTDFVFDGHAGPYREGDAPHPLNEYGRSKWIAEQIIQQGAISWAIVRTILVYGVPQDPNRSNFVLWVKRSLENQTAIRVVTDHVRMPTFVEDLTGACLQIVERDKTGIYHVCGPEIYRMYDMACELADFWRLDSSLIQPVLSQELQDTVSRPSYTGFIYTKAKTELEYRPTPFRAALARMDKQLAQ